MSGEIERTPVVKKIIGGWTELPEDQEDKSTHQLITNTEYDRILNRMQELVRENEHLKQMIISERQNYENIIRNNNKSYSENVAAIRSEAEERVEEAVQEAEKQKYLNENLIRISIERANAKRGLKPKKQHSGYVVISSSEKPYVLGRHDRYDSEYRKSIWETVIQTPHTVDLPEDIARERSEQKLLEEGMLRKIGITKRFRDGLKELEDIADGDNNNYFLESHIRANYKAGYWEFIFTHSKPLGIIPDEMKVTRKD